MKRIILVLALTAVPPGAVAQQTAAEIQQLRNQAQACSADAAQRYARTSTETAQKIAEAAFDRCRIAWSAYADAAGAKLDADPNMQEAKRNCIRLLGDSDPQCARGKPGSAYMMEAARAGWLHDAPVIVFEARAGR